MGLFGVDMNLKKYGVNDRESATVDLAKAILEQGRGATWLLASPLGTPLTTMRTMPAFPETKVDGHAQYLTATGPKEPWEVIGEDLRWTLNGAPRGHVDLNGRLVFECQYARINALKRTGPARFPKWGYFDLNAKYEIEGEERVRQGVILRGSEVLPESLELLALYSGQIRHYSLPATASRHELPCHVVMLVREDNTRPLKVGFMLIDEEVVQGWSSGQFTLA
jgi:hypothetical protein